MHGGDGAEALAYRAQECISLFVPETVDDGLEVVEVQVQHCH